MARILCRTVLRKRWARGKREKTGGRSAIRFIALRPPVFPALFPGGLDPFRQYFAPFGEPVTIWRNSPKMPAGMPRMVAAAALTTVLFPVLS